MPRAARKLDRNLCFPLITHTPRCRAVGEVEQKREREREDKLQHVVSRQFSSTTSLKTFSNKTQFTI